MVGQATTPRHLDVLVLWRHTTGMATKSKRTTVYFDPALHRALRLKAVETDQSLSDLVNAAVRETLVEDSNDLEAFETRAGEPSLSFEDVLKDLKRRGKL